ncbi:hypothetical protein Aph01nite_01970 [Acrocarpospora phusangensis]|uniref:Major facilitator superfamily (MFS) profile domain-containing protein n=1 Tax=Acrocarpospora phusangensis TaxID=1070424 RepID=A0A919UL82_9ACTN|nr:MFS transporter [Acrocarpospora phusangensis]GIH21887.1 hypothetical protein Aph01nite_01970 [Acrocarpospora phusangensis]
MNPWRALAVLCVANFLILVDTTIVNTAAPAIMTSLGAGVGQIVWILNGYLLAFASLLIVFGRVGDLFGPRNVFAAGLAVFTGASLLCALAAEPGLLVAARVAQGVGAAALVPQALALISAIFPADRRGLALGIFTAVAGVASVGGPTFGGLLVTRFGWQSVFLINLPVGLAALPLALRLIPDLRPPRPHRVTAVPGLFRHRPFTLAVAITGITSFSLYGLLLVYVIQTQTVLGMSPLMSGVTALPMTLALTALAPLSGKLADKVGGRLPLASGLTLYALGVLGLAFLTSTAATFLLPLALIGVGMGLAFAPATVEGLRPIPPLLAGVASGTLNTARQLGGAAGAFVIGALLGDGDYLAAARPALGLVAGLIAAGAALALFMPACSAAPPPGPRTPSTPAVPPPTGAAAP